jgi:hypothetical protein
LDVRGLLDSLDARIQNAKPVPLTDQVRLDKDEMYSTLDQMRAALPETAKLRRMQGEDQQGLVDSLPLIDRLDDLVHSAKPVPLTGQVRVSKAEFESILTEMRDNIASDRTTRREG